MLETELEAVRKGSVTENVEIIFSLAGDLFYITDSFNRPTCWMSVDVIMGVMSDDEKKSGAFGPEFLTITDNKSGLVHNRKVYGFWCWEVKSGEKRKIKIPTKPEEITAESEMVKDYILYHVQHKSWEGYS